MDKNIRIVYMGTPEFAVEALRQLIESRYNVVGVITMPDKPSGRGHHIQYSAVKEYAITQNLPLLQPENLKDEIFLENLRMWKADLQIVVAFRMLPEVVWKMPRLGTFNLHASLLPQYRGAAPINWAIINGEKETGITTFFLKQKIDTGEIIQQVRIPILNTDNAGTIHDKLMALSGNLVIDTVEQIIRGKVKSITQEDIKTNSKLHSAPKIFKDTCRINWALPIEQIYNFIRGLSPYPTAWGELVSPRGEKTIVKIYKSNKVTNIKKIANPGSIQTDLHHYLYVAGNDGYIDICELQIPGKKRMPIKEFLQGHDITDYYFMNKN